MKLVQSILGDECHFINGGAWSGNEYSEVGVKVIKVSNLVGDSIDETTMSYIPFDKLTVYKNHILQAHDLLVTTVGSHPQLKASAAGRAFILSARYEGSLLNQNAVCIRPIDEKRLDKRYLGYVGKSFAFQHFIQSAGRGAANQMRIAIGEIKKFKLQLPSLPEQQKISSILSAYDDLIENNLKRIELLEEAAQNIYKEWFGNFRFPDHQNSKFENGLPKGWVKVFIDDIASISGGGTPSTSEPKYWDGGNILWFSPTDLSKNNSLVLLDSAKKISAEGLTNSSAKLLPERTILMSSRATIGLFGIISKPCSTNQGFINIIPKDDILRYYLLFNLINRKDEIISKANGATFKEISKKNFKELVFVIPNIELIRQFHKISENIVNQIENLEKQISSLKEARDILLPRLMNGTITV